MSWLSRLSLVQRGLIALMSIVAIAFGAIAIPQLKQQLLPSIELPMVSVLAPYQGASPDVVEKQVIEPLEDGVQAVDGIKSVTSTSSEGSGVIMAQFDYGNDSDRLVADVQQAVNRARAKLPEDVDPQVVVEARRTISPPSSSPSPPGTRTSRRSPTSSSAASSRT